MSLPLMSPPAATPPPRCHARDSDTDSGAEGGGVWRLFVSSYCGLRDLPARVREEIRDLPWVAVVYAFFILVVDLGTVVLTYIAQSPDEAVYRALVLVYMVFHVSTTMHSVYAQNSYTFAAANLLLLCVTALIVCDYIKGITGFRIEPWLVVTQCSCLLIASLLATATYESMEGFGWKTFRDFGTKSDRVEVHSVYHKFTATLSLDFLLSIMLGLLSLLLISWPLWVYAVAGAFLVGVPLLLTIPLKKTVKAELLGALKGFVVVYALGLLTEVCVMVLGILEYVDFYWRLRLVSKNFPTAFVIIITAALAILVRLGLAYRTWVVVDVAFGRGHLAEVTKEHDKGRRAGSQMPLYGSVDPAERAPSYSSHVADAVQRLRNNTATASDSRQSPLPSSDPRAGMAYLFPSSTPQDAVFNSWTPTPTLGPVPILTAKTVSLSDKEVVGSTLS